MKLAYPPDVDMATIHWRAGKPVDSRNIVTRILAHVWELWRSAAAGQAAKKAEY